MQNHQDIKVLNGLIETTLDSADGYAEGARDAKSSSLVSIFREWATERRQVASMLQERVRLLGGEPEEEGTALASAHRMFVNLRAKLASDDNKAVVDEVERGEDHIKSKFEDAINDTDISRDTRSVIIDVYASVRNGHDQLRDIKKTMHE